MTRQRYCADCGEPYEAVDDADRTCKPCLLKRCRALVAALDERIREMGRI